MLGQANGGVSSTFNFPRLFVHGFTVEVGGLKVRLQMETLLRFPFPAKFPADIEENKKDQGRSRTNKRPNGTTGVSAFSNPVIPKYWVWYNKSVNEQPRARYMLTCCFRNYKSFEFAMPTSWLCEAIQNL